MTAYDDAIKELDEIVRLYLKGEGIDYLFEEVKRVERELREKRKREIREQP